MPIAITSRSRHSRIDQPLSYTKPLKVHVQEFRKLFSDKASLSLFSSFPPRIQPSEFASKYTSHLQIY